MEQFISHLEETWDFVHLRFEQHERSAKQSPAPEWAVVAASARLFVSKVAHSHPCRTRVKPSEHESPEGAPKHSPAGLSTPISSGRKHVTLPRRSPFCFRRATKLMVQRRLLRLDGVSSGNSGCSKKPSISTRSRPKSRLAANHRVSWSRRWSSRAYHQWLVVQQSKPAPKAATGGKRNDRCRKCVGDVSRRSTPKATELCSRPGAWSGSRRRSKPSYRHDCANGRVVAPRSGRVVESIVVEYGR